MNLTQAHSALKKYFGYDQFRPMQADIIHSVYDGKDALVLMPTGGGKSICYQIPAVTMDGLALVVSPLIALMKDQVEGLRANGVPAAFMNSSMSSSDQTAVENAALAGQIKILYVSPEKLVSQSFQPLLKRIRISLFAVDEAHCISAWGHDFRPEYTQLKFLRAQYPGVPLLALTATADKLTRRDILAQMDMNDAEVFVSSFDRPNISINVLPGQRRFEQLEAFIKQRPGQSGIIYCLARRTCVELAEKLMAKGYKAAPYHAELPSALRNKIQDDFINDRTPIICATIAFGMGIDKSNVRYIIHYNLPRNLEGYYQEIGRAGRDGLPSEALLFFSYADVQTYRQMFESGEASQEQKDLKIAKLNRMYQFAEAPVCRRKTVLNYFGDAYEDSCGNCDICRNPPKQFDGMVAVQKALSALLRTGEKVGMNLLVDVLRGSQRREIYENGFHQIKTYGAGKEYSFDEWIYLLSQMLHMGLLEIAYDEHSRLRVTQSGKDMLYAQKQVPLALPPSPKAATKKAEPATRPVSQTQQLRQELLDRLIQLRKKLSQQEGVPPYIVFSDVTLHALADKRPLTDLDLLQISGIGERKLQRYGDAILNCIREFVMEKVEGGQNLSGSTYLQTWEMFQQGEPIEAIAQTRGISPVTVISHLAVMYERGEMIDIHQWASPEELDIIKGALPLFQEPYQMKDIFEHFNKRYDYDKIRWGIADWKRAQKFK